MLYGRESSKFTLEANVPGFCTSRQREQHSRCYQAAHTGFCRAALPRWFYNTSSKTCMRFTYGGCGGNQNNFYSKSECDQFCRDPIYGVCAMLTNEKNCSYHKKQAKVRFNPENQKCEIYEAKCRNAENSFSNMNGCYTRCGEFVTNPCILPITPVKRTRSGGSCYKRLSMEIRYGYNPKTNKCEKFQWSKCNGNVNSFKTRKQCWETCAPKTPCLLTTEYHLWRFFTSYFYDANHDTCNLTKTYLRKELWPKQNRFLSKHNCVKECMPDHSTRL
ncbi:carboxypeptidase inhibitor SmCI-like [Dermacentor andersoni]|uniref:carboxypeptidase inhibitor SmCI-like n=1 Tax=Dermacentor andersoni TaxID=34620 RepID=UPI003B3B4256